MRGVAPRRFITEYLTRVLYHVTRGTTPCCAVALARVSAVPYELFKNWTANPRRLETIQNAQGTDKEPCGLC
jgi:hypothetical protein